jgi:hypothetical protein
VQNAQKGGQLAPDRTNGNTSLAPAPLGNSRALTHGSYARLRLSEAAGETADTLRELVPLKHDADTAAIETFAFVLEQLRAAGKALKDANRRADRLRLSQDAQGWANVALRYAKELGMTPKARAELGLDLVRAGAMVGDERDFDLACLSVKERATLEQLLDKAESGGGLTPPDTKSAQAPEKAETPNA